MWDIGLRCGKCQRRITLVESTIRQVLLFAFTLHMPSVAWGSLILRVGVWCRVTRMSAMQLD